MPKLPKPGRNPDGGSLSPITEEGRRGPMGPATPSGAAYLIRSGRRILIRRSVGPPR